MTALDTFFDQLWLVIVAFFTLIGDKLFMVTALFHPLGPALTISVVAFAGVCLTKGLNRLIITRRYRELEADFQYWREVREEAVRCDDREIGQRMARNIDQAKLNKAYYDYFFEGLLLGMARKVIPLFFLFAFVNEKYRPDQLELLFGRPYVLACPTTSGEPLLLGSIFWFVVSLLSGYLLWYLVSRISRRWFQAV